MSRCDTSVQEQIKALSQFSCLHNTYIMHVHGLDWRTVCTEQI